jgi:predicted component of type VI protein secretion system
MRVNFDRQGVTANVRPVPTDNTLIVMPLSGDRIGKDVEDGADLAPRAVDSTDDAFAKFKPELNLTHTIDDAEFVVEARFRSLRDFEPERLLKRVDGSRNDLADVHSRIELLNQLRARVAQAKVKKAWGNEAQRTQLIDAVKQFQQQITRISEGD